MLQHSFFSVIKTRIQWYIAFKTVAVHVNANCVDSVPQEIKALVMLNFGRGNDLRIKILSVIFLLQLDLIYVPILAEMRRDKSGEE